MYPMEYARYQIRHVLAQLPRNAAGQNLYGDLGTVYDQVRAEVQLLARVHEPVVFSSMTVHDWAEMYRWCPQNAHWLRLAETTEIESKGLQGVDYPKPPVETLEFVSKNGERRLMLYVDSRSAVRRMCGLRAVGETCKVVTCSLFSWGQTLIRNVAAKAMYRKFDCGKIQLVQHVLCNIDWSHPKSKPKVSCRK